MTKYGRVKSGTVKGPGPVDSRQSTADSFCRKAFPVDCGLSTADLFQAFRNLDDERARP